MHDMWALWPQDWQKVQRLLGKAASSLILVAEEKWFCVSGAQRLRQIGQGGRGVVQRAHEVGCRASKDEPALRFSGAEHVGFVHVMEREKPSLREAVSGSSSGARRER